MIENQGLTLARRSPTLPAMGNGTSGRLDRILAAATIAGRPSGTVLRLERLALRVNQTALAAQLGMSRQRLDILERRERLTPEMIERYRAALRVIVSIAQPDAAQGLSDDIR
jgi:DNA-binding Xre family transcriptional regulator